MVQPDSEDDNDSQGERVARVPVKSNRHKKLRKPDEPAQGEPRRHRPEAENSQLGKVTELLQSLTQQLDGLGKPKENTVRNVADTSESGYKPKKRTEKRGCFKCGEEDHYARRCPRYRWVQVPVGEADALAEGTTTSDQTTKNQSN